MAAAFYLYFDTIPIDKKAVIIWADNCAGQNKNWVLISGMLRLVNAHTNDIQTVRFGYLEPRHTAMASDAACQTIAKRIRALDRTEDFADLATIMQATGACDDTREHVKYDRWHQQVKAEAAG